MQGLIIEPHYIPNLRYFSRFLISKSIFLDDISLFRKQSYRNRSYILSANGSLPLIVPVCKGRSKTAFKDIRIDNSNLWQKNHWNSIVSAYNKSGYFEYYRHYFEGFYSKTYNYLLDLDIEIIKSISKILSLRNDIILLSEYDGNTEILSDCRNIIDPKLRFNKPDNSFVSVKYHQVFSERFDFIEDLGITDLIFNHGPDAKIILEKSVSPQP
jgi:hypothetical protein